MSSTIPPYLLSLLGGAGNQNLMNELSGKGSGDITSQSGPLALIQSPFFNNLQNMGQNYFSYTPQTGKAFSNLLGSINSQDTSVLAPLLADIDRQTKANVGSVESDFQDRGLGGMGQISTMEESALNQARGQGGIQKNDITANFLMNKANELTNAYGSAYGAANTGALESAGAYNNLLMASNQNTNHLADLLHNVWSGNASAWNSQQLQSMKDDAGKSSFLDTLSQSFAGSLGKQAGQGAGSLASALPALAL